MSGLFKSLFGKRMSTLDVDNDTMPSKKMCSSPNKQREITSNEASVISNDLQEKMMLFVDPNESITKPVVFSSFSLISALSMLLVGLTDETLKQVLSSLMIDNKNELFGKIVEVTDILNQTGCVKTSNVVMTKKNIPVMGPYLQKVQNLGEHFYFDQSEIKALASKVNSIVEKNTNGLIKNLLSPSDVTADTFLVLLNTIYFKSKWAEEFSKYNTKQKPFYRLESLEPKTVSMMRHNEEYFRYFENAEFQAISLPYEKYDFSMVIVLPIDKKKKAPVFNYERMSEVMGNMQSQCTNVELPKFEQESELDLIPFFKSNGMTQMFDYMHADEMIPRFDKQYVSVIKQKCKIIVDEKGTEASAATVIVACCQESCMMRQEPEKIFDFIADHPFSYHIVHRSGLILFTGSYC